MIKRISLVAALFFIGVVAIAQTQSEKEIKSLLAHKWKLTHVEMGGQKVEMPPEAGESFLDFKTDGTILKIDSEGEVKGKWTYDHPTKVISTEDEEGGEKYELVKINETEFIFKVNAGQQTVSMTLKRVK